MPNSVHIPEVTNTTDTDPTPDSPIPTPVKVRRAGEPVHKSTSPQHPELIRNGRQLALQQLDNLLSRPENLKKLYDDMQKLFDVSPTMFFDNVVMKLLPKQLTLDATNDAKAALQIILTNEPQETDLTKEHSTATKE